MSKGTSGFDLLRSAFGLLTSEPAPGDLEQESKALHEAASSGNPDAIREIATGMLNEADWKFSGCFAFTGINTCVLRSTEARFRFPVSSWVLLREARNLYVEVLEGNENARHTLMLVLLRQEHEEFSSMFSIASVAREKASHIVTCTFIGSPSQVKFRLHEKDANLFVPFLDK